jgi:hypothetical protein
MCYDLDLDNREFCQRSPTRREEKWLAFYRANRTEVRNLERGYRHERANKAEARRLGREVGHRGEVEPGSTEDALIGVLDVQKRATPEQLKAAPRVDGHSISKSPEMLPPKGKKPKGRKTSVQRAAAHARGEIGNALREQTLGIILGEKVPTAGKPTGLDLDYLEQAQRADSMVAAARDFCAEVKRTFPRRHELEEKLGPVAEKNRRWLEEHKRAVTEARAAHLNGRNFANHVASTGLPPKAPAKLRLLLRLAAAIPPHTDGALKDLAPERGPGAGGGWLGNVKLTVAVAGFLASCRFANVHRTRALEVELLAPEHLAVLYGTGPRGGPAAAAKAVVGVILKRSPQAVEAMLAQARAAETRTAR